MAPIDLARLRARTTALAVRFADPPAAAAAVRQLLDDYADRQCTGRAFTDYVGVPKAQSRYDVTEWKPTPTSWDAGDRRIACALYGDADLTASAHGTKR